MNPPHHLRVLHVYSGNLYGGIETFLRALAEERDKCPQMQPEFALCFEGRIAEELRASGAPVHMLGRVRLSRPWSVHNARRNLAKVLRTRRPDVVVCHAAWPYAIFSSVVRAAKTRLVFYRHDIGDARDWLNLLAGRVQPDVVIANSQYTSARGYPRFSAAERRTLFYVIRPTQPAIEGTSRASIRKELHALPDDVIIFQASRMQAWKGQSLLVEALVRLPRDLPWKCWLAGDAQRPLEVSYVAELKRAVRVGGIDDRVHFLGQRSDVPQLMIAADIFCQPNRTPEPFGIVFVEALAAGLAVVTTDAAGGALEILDGTCSLISLPNGADLASKLQILIETPALTNQLRDCAVRRAETFTNSAERLNELVIVLSEPRSQEHRAPKMVHAAP